MINNYDKSAVINKLFMEQCIVINTSINNQCAKTVYLPIHGIRQNIFVTRYMYACILCYWLHVCVHIRLPVTCMRVY